MDFYKLGLSNCLVNYVDILWLKQPFYWNKKNRVWEFHTQNSYSFLIPSVFVKLFLSTVNLAALYLGLKNRALCSETSFIGYSFQILLSFAMIAFDFTCCTLGKDITGLMNWSYSKRFWLHFHGKKLAHKIFCHHHSNIFLFFRISQILLQARSYIRWFFGN